MRQVISIIVVFVLLGTLFTMPAKAETGEWTFCSSADEVQLADTSKLSDEEFFGVWKDGEWITEGKLDYSYFDDNGETPLAVIGDYAKVGDYESASRELLAYYKNKNYEKKSVGGRSTKVADMTLDWIFTFDETLLQNFTVYGNEFKEYSFDVAESIEDKNENFMLFAHDKAASFADFGTKEGGNPAVLEIVLNGNEKRRYTAAADTYVSFEDRTANYGSEEKMRVCDYGVDSPFEDGNCRAYFRFSLFDSSAGEMRIKDSDVITSATLKLYGKTDDPAEKKDIMLFLPETKDFDENTMTWNSVTACTVSWNGIEGGTDWAQHDTEYNVNYEFVNVQTRFYTLKNLMAEYYATGDEKYIKGAFGILTDFSHDRDGPGYMRPLEVGERSSIFMTVYPHLLESVYMTPEVNTNLIKLFWLDADYLYQDENFWGFNNHGAVSTEGFLNISSMFPEFSGVSSGLWSEKIMQRIEKLTDLVFDDGYYSESDTGYGMLSLAKMYSYMELFEKMGVAMSDQFYNKFARFTQAMIDSAWPSGTLQQFGDGELAEDSSDQFIKIGEAYLKLDDPIYREYGNKFLYFGTHGKRGNKIEHESVYYPQARIGIQRRGWIDPNNALFGFINGGHAGGHDHRDKLSISIYAYGRALIKDTGMSSYSDQHPHYDFQKDQSRSHNVVEMDDYRAWDDVLDRTGGKTSTTSDMTINSCYDFFEGRTDLNRLKDDFEQKFDTRRKITFFKNLGFWIVSDYIIPPDESEHKYTQNWHMEPMTASITDDGTKRSVSNFRTGANVQIVPANPDAVTAELRDGYGMIENNSRLCTADQYPAYTVYKNGAANFDTVIFPTKDGDIRQVYSRPLDTGVESAVASAAEIDLNYPNHGEKVYYYIDQEESGEKRRFGDYEAAAQMCTVVKENNGRIRNLILQKGTELLEYNADGTSVFLIKSNSIINDFGYYRYGNTLELSSSASLEDIGNDIQIRVEENVSKVLYNGEVINAPVKNNYLILNANNGISDVNENPVTKLMEGYVGASGYDGSITFENGNASISLLPFTKVTGPSDWKGDISFTASKDGNEILLTVGKYGENLFLDLPCEISLSGFDISEISYMKDNGKWESLGMAASQDVPYIKSNNNGNIIISSKQLTEFLLKIKSPKNAGSGGGGGSWNGGSSGGSAGGTVVAPPTDTPDPTKPEIIDFNDTNGHWAKKEILFLSSLSIVKGEPDGNFYPDRKITRAEAAVLTARLLKLSSAEHNNLFTDVKGDEWYAAGVAACANAGIVQGSDGKFRPNDFITREELIKILVCACEKEVPRDSVFVFQDDENISDWARPYISRAVADGMITGTEENRILPKAAASRAEMAVMIYRIYEKLNSEVEK